ncbi:unnamed protein product [Ambrosiozyma monospora]|uniref:Unnamed protein product n=1 Tax=Ambrosiozyma monospora TaxID=43982 RepID=A0A9W6YXL1_AMBMO|nr:unnamed protein product [Ambrosiozyma monospora]
MAGLPKYNSFDSCCISVILEGLTMIFGGLYLSRCKKYLAGAEFGVNESPMFYTSLGLVFVSVSMAGNLCGRGIENRVYHAYNSCLGYAALLATIMFTINGIIHRHPEQDKNHSDLPHTLPDHWKWLTYANIVLSCFMLVAYYYTHAAYYALTSPMIEVRRKIKKVGACMMANIVFLLISLPMPIIVLILAGHRNENYPGRLLSCSIVMAVTSFIMAIGGIWCSHLVYHAYLSLAALSLMILSIVSAVRVHKTGIVLEIVLLSVSAGFSCFAFVFQVLIIFLCSREPLEYSSTGKEEVESDTQYENPFLSHEDPPAYGMNIRRQL